MISSANHASEKEDGNPDKLQHNSNGWSRCIAAENETATAHINQQPSKEQIKAKCLSKYRERFVHELQTTVDRESVEITQEVGVSSMLFDTGDPILRSGIEFHAPHFPTAARRVESVYERHDYETRRQSPSFRVHEQRSCHLNQAFPSSEKSDSDKSMLKLPNKEDEQRSRQYQRIHLRHANNGIPKSAAQDCTVRNKVDIDLTPHENGTSMPLHSSCGSSNAKPVLRSTTEDTASNNQLHESGMPTLVLRKMDSDEKQTASPCLLDDQETMASADHLRFQLPRDFVLNENVTEVHFRNMSSNWQTIRKPKSTLQRMHEKFSLKQASSVSGHEESDRSQQSTIGQMHDDRDRSMLVPVGRRGENEGGEKQNDAVTCQHINSSTSPIEENQRSMPTRNAVERTLEGMVHNWYDEKRELSNVVSALGAKRSPSVAVLDHARKRRKCYVAPTHADSTSRETLVISSRVLSATPTPPVIRKHAVSVVQNRNRCQQIHVDQTLDFQEIKQASETKLGSHIYPSVIDETKRTNLVAKDKKAPLRNNKQQRLLLLHHAARCPQEFGTCTDTPHCANMKRLLEHVTLCKMTACGVARCASSKQILRHFSRCKASSCQICLVTRQKNGKRRKIPTEQLPRHSPFARERGQQLLQP